MSSFPVSAYRLLRIALLFASGALVALLCFPLCRDHTRRALKASWSGAVVDALGVRIDADLTQLARGSLIVANHISWLDIFVINAVVPAAFVAKADVRQWPLIGWLAAKNDTIFLRRGSRGHAQIINAEIARLLDAGKHVAVFPEGTTTDGTHVLHFHGALIQPALLAGKPVSPLSIRYEKPDSTRSLAPRYDGDISLGGSLIALLRERETICRLTALTPISGVDRKTVAIEAHARIAATIGE